MQEDNTDGDHGGAGDAPCAIASKALVENDLKARRLVAPFGFVPSGLSYHLIYPARRGRNPDVAAFRDWFLDEANEPGGA